MGVGMCLVVDQQDAQKTVEILTDCGEQAKVIGFVDDGEKGVELC